ncbi:hypothetical protein [Pseudonocardia sp.]|uniref:hypothetical protein n=1 Tax=Pseudonocardia sp. TaxID=60912 RepID=UPI00260A2B14|nr:hypothetical protein [Pseudonocardia sp.]
MSSETDHPRQRTVAELLAEHGGGTGATGRRRRRREPDEPDEGPAPPGAGTFAGQAPAGEQRAPERRVPVLPDRSVLREPVPRTPHAPPPAPPAAPRPAVEDVPLFTSGPDRGPEREHPTDVMPRFRDAAPAVDEDLTGPMPQQNGVDPDGVDEGPSTMIGAAPVGAEAWHDARTADARRAGTSVDDAPPLPRGPVDADDGPAGLDPDDPFADEPSPVDLEKHDDAVEAPKPRERRLGRAAQASAGPAWATVMMQWIGGALGGAVLWVAFRFLWRNLPVVALASAVLVTVGLVVIVRALLHNDDRRTTIFAVLVGLLLTVSPAILVLLGR